MRFWWVNHNQTHRQEVEGGYIWSPIKNKDESKNQTYINLTEVRPGDVVFSYASQQIKAIGVAENVSEEVSRPEAFGKNGEQWANVGWLVPIRWQYLAVPFRPKDHLADIVPLLPNKYSPIQVSGTGNQKFYLSSISPDLGLLLTSIANGADNRIGEVVRSVQREISDDLEEKNVRRQLKSETEQRQLIWARRGQGIFRANLEKVEKRCRLTGVTATDVLIASHIKPWRMSDDFEKLDGNNGLLLSPHVDKLFDSGFITFSDGGEVRCSSDAIRALMIAWGLDPNRSVGAFSAQQKRYLDYHRAYIFKNETDVASFVRRGPYG